MEAIGRLGAIVKTMKCKRKQKITLLCQHGQGLCSYGCNVNLKPIELKYLKATDKLNV